MTTQDIEFKSAQPTPHFEGVFDISPQEVQQNAANLLLIDVRQPDEYVGELGHAPGAQLVVLDTLPDKLEDLSQDKQIIFICRSGGRSAKAAAFAHMQGWNRCYNMLGGMIEWNNQQLPVER